MTNKPKLLMLKGLPASGKSTYAKLLVSQGGWKRVNKDDLRAMIDDGEWSSSNEKIVKDIEQNLVFRFLRDGFNVVVDDTNFSYEAVWQTVANTCEADFEVKFFDTPIIECIELNSQRTGKARVENKVIWEMYNKYLKPKAIPLNPDLPNVYIFDIDGTLALMNGRSPYDYSKVNTDSLNRDVAMVYDKLALQNQIIVVSGRESSCREETMKWLKDNVIEHSGVFMRQTGDKRDDRIVKREIYEQNIKGRYNVLGVFDDRDRVVGMWRSLGLTCFQVNYGDF